MSNDLLVETVKMGLDGMVLVTTGVAAVGTLLLAGKRPIGHSVGALIVYALIALAVASCASPPPTRPRETSQERCAALVEQSCGLFASCYALPLDACLAERAGCADVLGITQPEADRCSAAMEQASCAQPVPPVCVGIAEASPRSPQPETRDL